jgi:hypothetical protein
MIRMCSTLQKYLNKNVPVLKITSSLMVDNISTFMQKTVSAQCCYGMNKGVVYVLEKVQLA